MNSQQDSLDRSLSCSVVRRLSWFVSGDSLESDIDTTWYASPALDPTNLPAEQAVRSASVEMCLLLSKHAYGSRVPWEGTQMKKRKKPKRLTKPRNIRRSKTKATPAVKQPKPAIKVAAGVRAKAARRTAEGKFTKVVFNQIGGTECPRFAAMTWKERDTFMAKPENAVVRDRYEKHMTSVGVK
jgi:hypothetical protein